MSVGEAGSGLHLRPEAPDRHVDQPRVAQEVVAPDALEEDLAREDLAGPPRQLHEQVELGPRERDLAAVAGDRPGRHVDGERAKPEASRVGGPAASAAKRRPDARNELGQLERLADVVVGPGLQADHDVERVAARGQHDDRDRRFAADLAGDLQAVEAGEHHVEQDEVGPLRPESRQPVAAVGRGDDAEAGPAQAERRDLADRRVVLDQQDASVHGQPPSCSSSRRASEIPRWCASSWRSVSSTPWTSAAGRASGAPAARGRA